MTPILYYEVSLVCIALLIVIWNRAVSTQHTETVPHAYLKVVKFSILFCAMDALWGIFASKTLDWGAIFTIITTNGFHAMSAIAAFVWSGYIFKYLNTHGTPKRIIQAMRSVLLVTELALLVWNLSSGWLWWFDENGIYQPQAPRKLLFVFQFAYYITCIVFSLQRFLRANNAHEKHHAATAVMFSVTPFITGILQMLDPDAPFYSIGFMLACFVIYSFNITSDREEYLASLKTEENNRRSMAIIETLTTEYTSVYYVDLNRDTWSVVRCDSAVQNSVNSMHDAGVSFSQMYRELMSSIVSSENRAEVLNFGRPESLRKALADKKFVSLIYNCNMGHGTEIYEIRAAKTGSDTSRPDTIIIGTANRDAELKREREYQAALEKAREAAENASNAKTEFLSHMSHDIRTPINGVIGMTEIAQKHLDDKERIADCLGKIDKSSHHLLSLINDVLDMSRIESGKTQMNCRPMNIITFVDNCRSIVQGQIVSRDLHLNCSVGDVRHPSLIGDDLHLRQVVLNILGNAIKFTPDGGHIDFEVNEGETLEDGRHMFTLVMRDTGVGMKPEFLEHIWEAFSQEDGGSRTNYKGTGLGMTITKKFVDMMGGTIDVESKLNEGSCFTVRIPFAEDANACAAAPVKTGNWSIQGLRLLLVEDNELNSEIAQELLSSEGAKVIAAENGRKAVEKFKEMPENYFDLILMDIMMPEMNGYEATRAIRALDRPDAATVPIIAMTANAFDEDVRHAHEAGMNAHLSKPVELNTLLKTVANYVTPKE